MQNLNYLLCFLVYFSILHFVPAQSVYFFSDALHAGYYDTGLAFETTPSKIDHTGPSDDKIPTDEQIVFAGENSLRLTWESKPNGDWQALVIAPGFPDQDITGSDVLSFWVYSEEGLAKELLPIVFIEAAPGAKKSNKFSLSPYTKDIPAEQWTQILVPLSIFWPQGDIDFTRTKAIIFGQDSADGMAHTLYIDEVKTFNSDIANQPITTPEGFQAQGYDSHVELQWTPNSESHLAGYNLYRRQSGTNDFERIKQFSANITRFQDFVGQNQSIEYTLTAVNEGGKESDYTDTLQAQTEVMSDSALLDMVQAYTFRYFWDFAHPHSGLIRERSNGNNENLVTIGGSGFGVMGILVGIERGFISRTEGLNRLVKIVDFLASADRFKGMWPHWMDGNTGKVIPFSQEDDGGDVVETAFMIQGLLTVRQYFDGDTPEEIHLRNTITQLWEEVDWRWYRKLVEKVIYWHWSPTHDFDINLPIRGYNEALIVYLLAIASPTKSVPANLYHEGWAGGNYTNGNIYYNYTLDVGPPLGGPLFFSHYSFMGFDPRFLRDNYTNYFQHAQHHTLVNRAYCIDNPKGFEGYSEVCWGLTASDNPFGYSAHEPRNDNGTITPTAALSSIPYTPEESLAALKHFYRELGPKLWGKMGFYDAFNQTKNWYANGYLAIDQGPILGMIENYRTCLLWKNFMKNPEITPALEQMGFVPDSTVDIIHAIEPPSGISFLNIYPNPAKAEVYVEFELNKPQRLKLILRNLEGKEIVNEAKMYTSDKHIKKIGIDHLPQGIYVLTIGDKNYKVIKSI